MLVYGGKPSVHALLGEDVQQLQETLERRDSHIKKLEEKLDSQNIVPVAPAPRLGWDFFTSGDAANARCKTFTPWPNRECAVKFFEHVNHDGAADRLVYYVGHAGPPTNATPNGEDQLDDDAHQPSAAQRNRHVGR